MANAISRALELIQEPDGKLSSTRLVFLAWGFGLLVGFFVGHPPDLEAYGFAATLGGLRIVQRFAEQATPAASSSDDTD